VPVFKDQKAEYLCEIVEDVLERWSIAKDRILAVTTDGAKNAKKAVIAELDLDWMYCVAHAINRAVFNAMKIDVIKDLLKKAKAIVKFFRNSPKASRILESQQSALRLESPKKLKLENKTRWNSSYKMMKRLIAIRPAVSSSLATAVGKTRKKPPPDLTSEEWALLAGIRNVLRPFKDATKFISQEVHPTIGFVFPILRRILKHYLLSHDSDAVSVRAFKVALKQDLSERWGILLENVSEPILLSVYLDPRFKSFLFVEEETSRIQLVAKAKAVANKWMGSILLSLDQVQQQVLPVINDERRQTLVDLFGDIVILHATDPDSGSLRTLEQELERYNQIANISFLSQANGKENVTDILSWWKLHQTEYPRLSEVARKVLCLTATSVPCERVFSRGGWIVNKRRCSLSRSTVSLLVFLSCNRQHQRAVVA